jgi:hypothetical protein
VILQYFINIHEYIAYNALKVITVS